MNTSVEESRYYNNSFLRSQCNPRRYLDSISYTVPLGDLIKLKKTCHYNLNMDYCPVLLEIMVPELQQHYKGNYILQVWARGGDKVYEKILKKDIHAWNCFYDYFMFKVDPREEDEGHFLYVVSFKDDFKEIKIKNFVTDPTYIHLGISQGLLHYGNGDFIKILDIKKDFGSSKQLVIIPKEEEILTYEIKAPCKLHGFFENSNSRDALYIMCMIETSDNQIDYSRLVFKSRNIQTADLEFVQYREVVRRQEKGDPIVKISQVILADEWHYGLALKRSGLVDIYWNFTRTYTTDELFTDIQSNFLSLFLKSELKQQTFKIDVKWDSRVGLDVAENFKFDQENWFNVINYQVKDFLKLFHGFTIVGTSFFICYNNVVSIFDIFKKMWDEHFILDSMVLDVLRTETQESYENFYVGALQKNGYIQGIFMTDEGKWQKIKDAPKSTGQGAIKNIVSDWRDIASHYIHLSSGELVGFQGSTVRSLTQDTGIKPDDEIIRYIGASPHLDFTVFNAERRSLKIFANYTSKQTECQATFVEEVIYSNDQIISDSLHAMVETEDPDTFLLFGNQNIYSVNKKLNEVKMIQENAMILSLQLIDGTYIYSLNNEFPKEGRDIGIFFQDLTQLRERPDQQFQFRLRGALAGVNNVIDYYKQDERIAYMSDFNKIIITPVLHRNTINFIGMKDTDDYIGFVRQKDKVIALDKKNVLTSWSITTGKVMSQYHLKEEVVSKNMEIYRTDSQDNFYKSGWNGNKFLLYDKDTNIEVDKNSFFGDRLKTVLNNETAYASIETVSFRNFKLIEIVSDTQVKVHFDFIHQHYGFGQYQRIYFSQNLEYMLERLQNQRVFLYKRVNKPQTGKTTWEEVRRLKQFPMDISEQCYVNYLFSPDLMYYIDFDKSDDQFLIKITIDQTLKCIIPRGLMNPNTTDPKDLIKKFRWLNSSLIKIINEEGIEKIIDIENGFKDVNQDTVPMIDLAEINDKDYKHYYFAPKTYSHGQTYERLIRKFQSYNSVTTLEGINEQDILHDTIFEVEFPTNDLYKPVAEMSFTFVHWKLAETLASPGNKIRIKNLNIKLVKMLAMNIFPQANTILHCCYNQINTIRKIYQVIQNDNVSSETNSIVFEVPFIQNFGHQTPLHLCLNSKNYKSADVFLQCLAGTPLDSHARSIVDILPDCVENGLISFGPYMEKRILQTRQLINRGAERAAIKYKEGLNYGLGTCELWPDMNQVDQILFQQNTLDSEVKIEFLDMTKLHSYSEKTGDEFFHALADAEDIEIFSYRSIQAIIDYKWPLARNATVIVLFVPFLIYHVVFLVYMNLFNGQYSMGVDQNGNPDITDQWYQSQLGLGIILYIFSIYFLINEARQVINSCQDYFLSVWNYTDFVPPLMIIIIVSYFNVVTYDPSFVATNQGIVSIEAIASILMWLKLLYFLRIFKSTGYLVRMVTDVFWGVRTFTLILVIMYFGFAEAFMRVSEASDPSAQFTGNYFFAFCYVFMTSIGSTSTNTFNFTVQPAYCWILFVGYLILSNVVMLNLLIQILSKIFTEINDNAVQANYQERARIISENSYLIPARMKAKLDDFDKYLIIVREIQDDEDTAVISSKVKTLTDDIVAFKKQVLNKQQYLESKIDKILSKA